MPQEELKKRKKTFPTARFEPLALRVVPVKEGGRPNHLGHPAKLCIELQILLVNPRRFSRFGDGAGQLSAM